LNQLEELRPRDKTAVPVTNVKETQDQRAMVTVSVPGAQAPNNPVVFDVRIEHH
jgi:hypothetical protein